MTKSHIFSIVKIDLSVLEKFPSSLEIHAKGECRTDGYYNPELSPRIYVTPPLNGIWEFDFVASKIEGPVTEVITNIETMYSWDNYPTDLKGIKIYTETN